MVREKHCHRYQVRSHSSEAPTTWTVSSKSTANIKVNGPGQLGALLAPQTLIAIIQSKIIMDQTCDT